MERFLLPVIATFLFCEVSSQPIKYIEQPYKNSPQIWLSENFHNADFEIAKKVFKKLEFREHRTILNDELHQIIFNQSERSLSLGVTFFREAYTTNGLSLTIHNKHRLYLESGDTAYFYGFNTGGVRSRTFNNISVFFSSAYLQEKNKEYASDESNFIDYQPVSRRKFIKRLWMNSGLALHYLSKDNPFYRSATIVNLGYALFDILPIGIIAMSPVIAGSTSGAIGIAKLGILFSLSFKGITYWATKEYIDFSNRVGNSGYKVPKNIDTRKLHEISIDQIKDEIYD